MRKNKVIVSLCLSVFLMSCDNYLDLVPKGESVLNTTDDYLGLVESMTSEFPTDDFWYFSGDATWPYKNEIENYYSDRFNECRICHLGKFQQRGQFEICGSGG